MEENKVMSEFEGRAYKMLYEKYKSVFERIYNEAKNHSELGDEESKNKWIGFIGNLEKYSFSGLVSKEDITVINALEKCLDIDSSLGNAK